MCQMTKTLRIFAATAVLFACSGCGGKTDMGSSSLGDSKHQGGSSSWTMSDGGGENGGGENGGADGGFTSAPTTSPNQGGMGGSAVTHAGGKAAGGAAVTTSGGYSTNTNKAAGGAVAAGGKPNGGAGSKATGGGVNSGGNANGGATAGAPPVGAPVVTDNGYVTLSTGTVIMAGYISSSTAGSGSSVSLTYASNTFCASGTVAADAKYKSWVVAGFSVNQDSSGGSGSSTPLVLDGSELSISYANNAGSPLRFQIYDGSRYWCYDLPAAMGSGTSAIPFSKLNTQCWDGGGSAFTSGTAITTVELVVGGGATTKTPFDFCFLGLTVK
jgi:hypothetical protein